MGNFLVGVGCILLISASQQELLNKRSEQDITAEVNQLKEKLADLEKRVK